MNTKQLVDDFLKLDILDKRKKLLLMAEQIKDSDPLFMELYELLKTKDFIELDILDWLYQDILNLSDALKTHSIQKQQESFISIQQKMKEMRELEEIEHKKDLEDIENLLDNI